MNRARAASGQATRVSHAQRRTPRDMMQRHNQAQIRSRTLGNLQKCGKRGHTTQRHHAIHDATTHIPGREAGGRGGLELGPRVQEPQRRQVLLHLSSRTRHQTEPRNDQLRMQAQSNDAATRNDSHNSAAPRISSEPARKQRRSEAHPQTWQQNCTHLQPGAAIFEQRRVDNGDRHCTPRRQDRSANTPRQGRVSQSFTRDTDRAVRSRANGAY